MLFYAGESVAAEMPGLLALQDVVTRQAACVSTLRARPSYRAAPAGEGGSALSTCSLLIKTAAQKPWEKCLRFFNSTLRAFRFPAAVRLPEGLVNGQAAFV